MEKMAANIIVKIKLLTDNNNGSSLFHVGRSN